jgi:hypothetical protein
MSYTQVSVAGYNASPPPDDGSTGQNNQVVWSRIKTKLFDPIKTAVASIDDNVSSAITTADTTLSTLQSGVSTASSNVSNLATTLAAPSGTLMLFQQTSAPTGWSKSATYDDYMVRVVTGTASSGGSTAFSSVLTSRTITSSNLPSHTHTFSDTDRACTLTGSTSFIWDISDSTSATACCGKTVYANASNDNANVVATIDISGTTGSNGSSTAMDFAVTYVDTIIATKS